MGGEDEFSAGQIYKFQQIYQRFTRMVCRNTEQFNNECSWILDELNALDFPGKIVKQEDVSALLRQCCHLVQLKHEHLVTKVCVLTVNLLSVQKMVLLNAAEPMTEYLIEALQLCSAEVTPYILHALGAVIYENSGKLLKYHDLLLGRKGLLTEIISCAGDAKVLWGAIQCVDSFTIRTPNCCYLSDDHQADCLQLLISICKRTSWPDSMDEVTHSKILINAIRGIQNMVLATKIVNNQQLGSILAALKVYMLHGLPGVPVAMPMTLQPDPVSQYDTTTGVSVPSPSKSGGDAPGVIHTPDAGKPAGKGRKKRANKNKSKSSSTHDVCDQMDELSVSGGAAWSDRNDPYGLSVWANMSSSESEFSDSEGVAGKVKAAQSKVRHSVLACFHAVVKATDKRTMFGYWSSFIPNTPGIGPPPQSHTLFTVIIKDPTPKARTGALAVLTALLEGSKQYLMVAEEIDQYRTAPFTPFSVTLGYMIKEINRCLLLALIAENSPRAVTQIIKLLHLPWLAKVVAMISKEFRKMTKVCLATLVPNVPYQRLKPGLLTKVVKHLKPFMSHRDPNIRVGCLTCLGAIVSTQCPLLEVCHVLQPRSLPRISLSSSCNTDSALSIDNPSSLATTPSDSSGSLTPMSMPADGGDICWMVRMCVGNVAPHLVDDTEGVASASDAPQPLPVRLESLQLLAQLCKGYFPVVRNCLLLIRRLVEFCLRDSDPAVQLHGTKLLEVTTTAMTQYAEDTAECTQVQDFWLYIISSLLPLATVPGNYYAVRSTGCDCLANIGPVMFHKIPMDKQVLCITWLLGMTHDENHHVRAAAIRGLGIYVLYPCLREDVSFVADTANAVTVAMKDTSVVVRAKAAWSLGNLTDALVLIKDDGDAEFIDDFSDMLLLKLFDLAIAGCHDNDKVKYNTVRALGSLLHYLPVRIIDNSQFNKTVELAIAALIKNINAGSMKVRWNACYAVGQMLHNESLAFGDATWIHDIYKALTSVVQQCNNFKVKINAATALSVPQTRRCYGDVTEMTSIWDGLVGALRTAESITDFGEFRYREHLVDQVCRALIHLSKLLQRSDLDLVGASLSNDADLLEGYMLKYKHMLDANASEATVEKKSVMSAAVTYLASLGDQDNLSDSEHTCVRLLTQLLNTPLPKDQKPTFTATPSSPVNFLQTYD